MDWLISYYLVINILTYGLYGLDKWKAKRGYWRIPEKVLLGTAFLGGAAGAAAGMGRFHHKTRKIRFKLLVPLFMVCHALLVCIIVYKGAAG
ncbi:MAG: DUF1294 domain-containing protein [Bacteroidales bacterium]|nr:DUF1294 domain-containing protein [Clostridium sp.]MCM1204206.1 DUF1294 domain-containing protein [Bacteroidales bacterium]